MEPHTCEPRTSQATMQVAAAQRTWQWRFLVVVEMKSSDDYEIAVHREAAGSLRLEQSGTDKLGVSDRRLFWNTDGYAPTCAAKAITHNPERAIAALACAVRAGLLKLLISLSGFWASFAICVYKSVLNPLVHRCRNASLPFSEP